MRKSPTETVRTQGNHCLTLIYAFVKLEQMKVVTKVNHFALRSRIYLKQSKQPAESYNGCACPTLSSGSVCKMN